MIMRHVGKQVVGHMGVCNVVEKEVKEAEGPVHSR